MKKFFKPAWILTLIRSFYFNFKYLPFYQAINLPILIDYSVKFEIKNGNFRKGKLIVPDGAKRFGIKLGFFWGGYIPNEGRTYFRIDEGEIEFKGTARITRGFNISSFKGRIEFGNNFSANHNLHILSYKDITFGENVLIGWNCTIRDSDSHAINEKVGMGTISIGDNVWIASFVDILHGVGIKSKCVIATHSLVTEKISNLHQEYSLIGGSPAKLLKKDIIWKE